MPREGSRDFSQLAHYTEAFRRGAARYDVGQSASHVNIAATVAALEVLGQWSPTAVSAHAGEPSPPLRRHPSLPLEISERRVPLTHSGGRPTVQRALVFLGVVLAVVILGWLHQRQEISRWRADLAGATSALSVDPDSIVRVETSLAIGPTAVDMNKAACPAGYRVAYGWFEHHPDPLAVPLLVEALLKESSEFVRPALLRALAASGDPRAREAVMPLIMRGQDDFRSGLIAALGDYRASYALNAIIDVAKLEGPLQDDAVVAAGKIGGDAVRPLLIELQRNGSRAIQPAVAAAMLRGFRNRAIAGEIALVVVAIVDGVAEG